MEYRVYYCCHETGDVVDSHTPYATDKDTVLAMAQQLLRADGDFFGIIDENEVTLQFMVQGESDLWMELPVPERRGSYGRVIPFAELESTLISVTPPFDPEAIEGMRFEAW